MPLHPRTPLSLASFKSRLVLPFWYLLTKVFLEKRLLNGCSIVHTHTCLTALFPGLSRWAGTRKTKPVWILLNQETSRMQVCTLLQTDNHASTPSLGFYRPDALPATQPTALKHWRCSIVVVSKYFCNKRWSERKSCCEYVLINLRVTVTIYLSCTCCKQLRVLYLCVWKYVIARVCLSSHGLMTMEAECSTSPTFIFGHVECFIQLQSRPFSSVSSLRWSSVHLVPWTVSSKTVFSE